MVNQVSILVLENLIEFIFIQIIHKHLTKQSLHITAIPVPSIDRMGYEPLTRANPLTFNGSASYGNTFVPSHSIETGREEQQGNRRSSHHL